MNCAQNWIFLSTSSEKIWYRRALLTIINESLGLQYTINNLSFQQIDGDITKIMNTCLEKQKRFARYAEKLSKVKELSRQLNRCHMLLNQTLESIETLNNYLPIEDRLEPFVWTTG